jgi:broad specificity phosphatase PhoE
VALREGHRGEGRVRDDRLMGAILLVRHAQASFGAENYDALSELGHQQASVLGEALRGLRIDLVMRGNMRRHHETADGCLRAMGISVPVEIDSGFDEYDHRAVLSRGAGSNFVELFASAIARWQSGEHDGEYAESYEAFSERSLAAVERVAQRLAKGGTALVFTSGGPISVICGSLLSVPPPRQLDIALTLCNGSISKVLTNQGELRFSTLNEHSHFSRALVTYK